MLFEPNIEPAPAMQPVPLPAFDGISEQQKTLLASFGVDPMSVDDLVDSTRLPVHIILQEMTFLTLKAHVRRIDGQTWARRT
jgi:predicted Rossmann fold nucleotide-binding protein DprA/Smf involved in DNA uptake